MGRGRRTNVATQYASCERGPTVAQRGLSRPQSQLPFDQPKFPRPVRKSPAQPLQIGMAGPERPFDFRDLLAAASDSFGPPPAFRRDLFEGAPIWLELRWFAAERLPTLDHHIHVIRSSSIPRQTRSVSSAAARVVPSRGMARIPVRRVLRWFRIGRRMSSAGFCVGWSHFS